MTANGRTHRRQLPRGGRSSDESVIRPFDEPLLHDAGFIVLTGNLFDSAIMKTSVISDGVRARYLSNPDDPGSLRGPAVVFDGPEDYHARIDDPALGSTRTRILVMRGAGPIGYPGAAEVVNMQPPAYLLSEGIHTLPCIGDGRQSGTSGSALRSSTPRPEAAVGRRARAAADRRPRPRRPGKCTADILISDESWRAGARSCEAAGGYAYPASQTPWQEIQRGSSASGTAWC